MGAPVSILPEVASGVASLGNTLLSNFLGRSNMDKQVKQAIELMDYQWNHYQSPSAQVAAYGAAGLNPAVMFGSPQGQLATPSVNQPTPSYAPVDMLRGMDGFANYIRAVAEAKKAGVETRNLEKDLELKQVDQETKEFALSLQKLYGNRQKVLELSLLRRNIVLAMDNHDINEYDKLIKEWDSMTASIVNEAEGYKKGILKKQFDNEDARLRLSNRVLEGQGTAAFAAAEVSKSQAEVNRENRRLQGALADIEESTKSAKIESLISEYEKNGWLNEADANEARLRASRLHGVDLRRDNSRFFKAVDDLSEWIKSKAKIFSK